MSVVIREIYQGNNYLLDPTPPRAITMKSAMMAVACAAGAQAFVAPRSVLVYSFLSSHGTAAHQMHVLFCYPGRASGRSGHFVMIELEAFIRGVGQVTSGDRYADGSRSV